LLTPTETPLDDSETSLDDPVTPTKPLNITSEISADALPSYTFGIIRASTIDKTFGVITPTGRTIDEEDKT
jgi:hypothetical protein